MRKTGPDDLRRPRHLTGEVIYTTQAYKGLPSTSLLVRHYAAVAELEDHLAKIAGPRKVLIGEDDVFRFHSSAASKHDEALLTPKPDSIKPVLLLKQSSLVTII